MIAGTDFCFAPPEFVTTACAHLPPSLATPSEILEIQAECEAQRAVCLACADGMVVIELRPHGDALEMFIQVGVAFRHGAWERQGPALRAIARDLGAQTVAFEARRRGWSRRLGPEWTRRGTREFMRSV